MLGGEKKGKKVSKKKPAVSGRKINTSEKVNLKVKIHQPEIKKVSAKKFIDNDNEEPKIVSKKKSVIAKLPDKKIINNFKSEQESKKIKIETDKRTPDRPKDEYKEYRQKQTIMWTGIVFFMILIIFVWTYNIKKTFKAIEAEKSSQAITSGIDQIGDELSAKMKEMKENLEEIKAYGNQIASTTATSTSEIATSTDQNITNQKYNQLPTDTNAVASTSSTTASDISRQELDELKAKLKDLENKINKN